MSIPMKVPSLVLVRDYSAYALALHAQDCPDWKPEKPSFSLLLLYKCITIPEKIQSLVLSGRYRAHASAFTCTIDCPS